MFACTHAHHAHCLYCLKLISVIEIYEWMIALLQLSCRLPNMSAIQPTTSSNVCSPGSPICGIQSSGKDHQDLVGRVSRRAARHPTPTDSPRYDMLSRKQTKPISL